MTSLLLALSLSHAAEVVVFGDSWAEGSHDELEDALRAAGHPFDTADHGVGGTTAIYWNSEAPGALSAAVAANPDARWVWLSILGNDTFLHHAESAGGTAAARNRAELEALVDRLHADHPDVKVAIFSYDYVNFEQSVECILTASLYFPQLVSWGGLNSFEVNGIFHRDVDAVQAAVAAARPWMTHHTFFGTLQAAGGIPGAPQQLLPSPSGYMADCIHPTSTGYRLIHDRLVAAYWGHPTPTATITGVPTEAVCEGDATVLGASTTQADAISWRVDGAEAGSSPSVSVPGVAGAHSVRLRAEGGAWRAEDEATFQVLSRPTAVVAGDATICAGDGVSLSATGGSTVRWTPTTGLSDPTAATPWATPAETTTWTAEVSVAPGCTDTGEVTVVVHPTPTLELDLPATIAPLEDTVLRAQVSPSTAVPSWFVDDTLVGTGSEIVVRLEEGVHALRVDASTDEGCGSSLEAVLTVDAELDEGPVDEEPFRDAAVQGCGCASGSRAPGPWTVLLAVGLVRRRRRTR